MNKRYAFTVNGKIFFDNCKTKEEAYGELKVYLDEMYTVDWEDVFICKEHKSDCKCKLCVRCPVEELK